MIEQNKIYTTQRRESSGRGEMFRAVVLVREATRLLKSKARHLPDCPPGARLQKIAIGLGNFSNSLERAATAIELGHHRKSPKAFTGEAKHPSDTRMNLSQLESGLTEGLRRIAIGSMTARQLYALRACVREELAAASCDEHEMTECTVEQSAGGAA